MKYATALGVPVAPADATSALQSALNSVASKGGTIILDDNEQFYIAGNLTVPRGVTLRGALDAVGIRGNNSAQDFNTQAGIRLNPAAKITLKGSATLYGLLIVNANVTYPAANSNGFTGTAVYMDEDDSAILNSMIIGFERCVDSYGAQRVRMERVNLDGKNGVRLRNSLDICYLRECHAWPFGTISTITNGDVTRPGIGFEIADTGDWTKLTDCFAYGYITDFRVANANSVTFTGCGADNVVNAQRAAIGFLTEGYAEDVSFVNCQAAASNKGFVLAHSIGRSMIVASKAWANTECALQIIYNQPVILSDNIFRDTPTPVHNYGGSPIYTSPAYIT